MIRREYSRSARAEARLVSARARGDDMGKRTDLDHLPPGKRRELAFVVDVLRETFARECATRSSPELRGGAILKIILFGSYARGGWSPGPIPMAGRGPCSTATTCAGFSFTPASTVAAAKG